MIWMDGKGEEGRESTRTRPLGARPARRPPDMILFLFPSPVPGSNANHERRQSEGEKPSRLHTHTHIHSSSATDTEQSRLARRRRPRPPSRLGPRLARASAPATTTPRIYSGPSGRARLGVPQSNSIDWLALPPLFNSVPLASTHSRTAAEQARASLNAPLSPPHGFPARNTDTRSPVRAPLRGSPRRRSTLSRLVFGRLGANVPGPGRPRARGRPRFGAQAPAAGPLSFRTR